MWYLCVWGGVTLLRQSSWGNSLGVMVCFKSFPEGWFSVASPLSQGLMWPQGGQWDGAGPCPQPKDPLQPMDLCPPSTAFWSSSLSLLLREVSGTPCSLDTGPLTIPFSQLEMSSCLRTDFPSTPTPPTYTLPKAITIPLSLSLELSPTFLVRLGPLATWISSSCVAEGAVSLDLDFFNEWRCSSSPGHLLSTWCV